MRLTHSLPAVALGAVALGATLGADPADAHAPSPVPSPTGLRPAQAAAPPTSVEALLPRVVESPLAIALPLPSSIPLPLPSDSPLPLPLPSDVPLPLPLPSDVPLPSTSVKPSAVIPDLPRTPPRSPSPTARVASPAASPAARSASSPSPSPLPPSSPSTSATVTVSRDGFDRADGNRTRSADQSQAVVAAAAAPTPGSPARPEPGPPAFVLARASTPGGFGASGVDAPTSTGECPPHISPLSRGLTVAAVDMRATSRPVERGPPPPQRLLITQPRPRR
ncbi:hypothetical protein [Micromonospora sp. B9E7]|uniref:hypothetical protein n=1 Tax=Micromonospora sp. B9E7 TaxID=3153574 RepID=UPI00325ED9CB